MNKRIREIAVFLLMALLLGSTVVVQAEEEPKLSFVAVSDLHLDDLLFQTSDKNIDQYRRTMRQAHARGVNTLICGGDISSYGNTDYWYTAREIAQEEGVTETYWALGNHAYGTSGLMSNVKENFMSFCGESSIWYTKEIRGYQFIFLAVDHGDITEFGEFSDQQLAWFAAALRDAAEKANGRPVFVVSHFDLGTGDTRALLEPELCKYDNVFFLWGHEHGWGGDDMTLADIITDEPGYTAAKMGMMHYYLTDTSEGLLVRVYDDRVELEVMRVGGVTLSQSERDITNAYTVKLVNTGNETVSTQKVFHGSTYTPPEDTETSVWLGGEEIVAEMTTWQEVLRPRWNVTGNEMHVTVDLPAHREKICLVAAVYDASGRQVGMAIKCVAAGERHEEFITVSAVGQVVRVYQVAADMAMPLEKSLDALA